MVVLLVLAIGGTACSHNGTDPEPTPPEPPVQEESVRDQSRYVNRLCRRSQGTAAQPSTFFSLFQTNRVDGHLVLIIVVVSLEDGESDDDILSAVGRKVIFNVVVELRLVLSAALVDELPGSVAG